MEIIGFIIAAFVGWKVFFWFLSIIFPQYGVRRAMAKYQENPTEANLQVVMRAQRRLSRRMGH